MRDYTWAWGASLAWALVPSLAKMGMSQGFPPIAGTLVAMVVTVLALSFFVALPGMGRRVRAMDQGSLVFVIGCGVGTGLAGLSYFTALTLGTVSLVTVITSGGQPLGSLVLAFIFLRHKERLGWPAALGTLLMVTGIYFIMF